MKKILLLIVLSLISVSLSMGLEPMKVAFVYTAGTPTSVQVQLADNTSSSLFVGENLTSNITPSSSGIIILNVQDHAGSGTTWSNYNASNITTYHTLDIYVNGTLYAQYRLDALILAQAQTSVFDNNGNFNPTQTGASLGTDELRWNSGYFEGNTVHIGPADGEANTDELSFSYDDATNTATMTVAGTTALISVNDNVNIPKQTTINGLRVGEGGGEVNDNTALGRNVLFSNTTGYSNTAIGSDVLYSNTTGNNNTGVGSGALLSNSTGNSNTAIGVQVLASNTTGRYNTAVGVSTLVSNTTGEGNVALGALSMAFNTTGSDNTAIGQESLVNNTTGIENTAVGKNALQSNTTAAYNSALGFNALRNNTTGSNNTAIGSEAMQFNTTGSDNVALGKEAMDFNTTGNNNIAVGTEAMRVNQTGSRNTIVGHSSLYNNTNGNHNSALGYQALVNNSTGLNNTAIGYSAGSSITTGSNNSFVGNNAGNSGSQKVDAQNSIAIGSNTFTTADNQVVIGNSSITETNLNGVLNVPQHAVVDGITIGQGGGNVASNTATGVNALVSNSTGTSNTAFGTNALTSNSTGSSNTAIGSFSFNNSTGDENTSIGSFAGFSLTTGSDNTFIGSQAGNNGSQKVDVQNSIAIGSGTHTTADNQVVIGDANINETQLRGVTLMDLAGGGTQNIQVDNTGKIITGGGGGGGGGATASTDTPVSLTVSGTYQDTGIEFSLDANTVYQIYGYIQVNETGSGKIDTRINYTGSFTSGFFDGDFGYDASNFEDLNTSVLASPYNFIGTIVTNTAGTFKIQIKNNPSNTGTNTLNGSSQVTLVKM